MFYGKLNRSNCSILRSWLIHNNMVFSTNTNRRTKIKLDMFRELILILCSPELHKQLPKISYRDSETLCINKIHEMDNKTNQTVLKTARDIFVNIHINSSSEYKFFYFVLQYVFWRK